MGRTGAFLNVDRHEHYVRAAKEAVNDFEEFVVPLPTDEQCEQAARCMNCGVAFCQSGITLDDSRSLVGCPLQNMIPETNDLLYRKRFQDAVGRLYLTNPFPEFTGRVCPAPCEDACNLGLNNDAVTIHDNERALSDYAWEQGMEPLPKAATDAPLVSVIGSGPAGLAAAWELARKGIRVRVIERAEKPGGLLMFGIPNMKLSKDIVDRRIKLMEDSGIEFACNTDAIAKADSILEDSDAVVIATGATVPRRVDVEGAELDGIYMAVDYLSEVTRALLDGRDSTITAKDKDVVVIGGGDTGVDCVASALRQGARSVKQVIRAQCPPLDCDTHEQWPYARKVYTQGYGQREAEELLGEDPRIWSTDTIGFIGNGSVEAVRIQDLSYDGKRHLVEGTEREIPAQLVLIAKGFLGPERSLFGAMGIEVDKTQEHSHKASTDDIATPVYVAGDAHQGATLVATAIADGLACAEEVASNLQ